MKRVPAPEQVFLSWLMAQPENIDLTVAAMREVARLSRYDGPHEGPVRLRGMFVSLVEELGGSAH
ncbi:hypothetical protein [Mesorhizobium sp. CAU 1732]|uniref:hypothetical protein n=1 Tax=Mesorhizobium sp. CAU 1732 TaxID=3140358 RepID=UPI0032601774